MASPRNSQIATWLIIINMLENHIMLGKLHETAKALPYRIRRSKATAMEKIFNLASQ